MLWFELSASIFIFIFYVVRLGFRGSDVLSSFCSCSRLFLRLLGVLALVVSS